MSKLNKYGEIEDTECPQCGNPTKPTWKACPECGVPTARAKANSDCHQCGSSINPGWVSCPFCRAQIGNVAISLKYLCPGCGEKSGAFTSENRGKGILCNKCGTFVHDECTVLLNDTKGGRYPAHVGCPVCNSHIADRKYPSLYPPGQAPSN